MEMKPQKRSAPSARRNRIAIGKALGRILPENARVLEIASGTGEHGDWFTQIRPDIVWQYSDIDPQALASQTAYAQEKTALLAPLDLDVMDANWPEKAGPADVIYCANMIHISPWQAAQGLVQGAARILPQKGMLILYGPFLRGSVSARSNLEFDAALRARNPQWGVREFEDVTALMARSGFRLKHEMAMPRDNHLLVFGKS